MAASNRPGGDPVAAALHATLITPNETDSNMEPANIVDGLFAIARAIDSLAVAVTRVSHGDVHGATGLEMLSIAVNGPGAIGHDAVTTAIRDGFHEVAEVISDAIAK